MRSEIIVASIITITLINVFFSINIFKSNSEFYVNEIDRLMSMNESIRSELKEFHKYGISVDVTMYQPTYQQTDLQNAQELLWAFATFFETRWDISVHYEETKQ